MTGFLKLLKTCIPKFVLIFQLQAQIQAQIQIARHSPIQVFQMPNVSSRSFTKGSPIISARRKMTTFGARQRLIATINTNLETGENVMKIVQP